MMNENYFFVIYVVVFIRGKIAFVYYNIISGLIYILMGLLV